MQFPIVIILSLSLFYHYFNQLTKNWYILKPIKLKTLSYIAKSEFYQKYIFKLIIVIYITQLHIYNSLIAEMDNSDNEEIKKKKKYSKKAENVPMKDLGFQAVLHADIIDPRNRKRIPYRHRKKYTAKSTKQNFMARLRMVIDVNDLPPDTQNHLFKVTKKSDWAYVKKVFYRSREKVHCYICLQQNIIAPQITYCGHIYCFHCILMHFKISSNCFACPVCKQVTDRNQLKTCEPKYQQQFSIKDQITLNLKYRQGHYLYNADTLYEDFETTQMIRMRTKGISSIFAKQLQQIKKQLQKTQQNDRIYVYLTEALTIVTQKIANAQKKINHLHINLRQNQTIKQDTIVRFITAQQQKRLHSFYQQKSGSYIFLHKFCKKYITANKQNAPICLKSKILDKQQLDFSAQQNQYKQISLFNAGIEVDVVSIELSQYISAEQNVKYLEQIQKIRQKRQQYEKQQQIELQILRKQYEQDQQIIRKLKQRQQSLYYFDVKLPPTLDPSDINEHSFPSLIGSKSEATQESKQLTKQQMQVPIIPVITKRKTQVIETQKKFDLSNQVESFPDISQLQHNRSAEPASTISSKKGKKKKKQKFVDMTKQIFGAHVEEELD